MYIYDIIEKKRNKKELSKEEINFFIRSLVDGKIEDSLVSAFLMATVINGMTFNETLYLTLAMRDSSEVLTFDEFIVDKHSTGGVSDTTTLILVPILASLGVKVGKMSGRSLGFTGGTIDKLEVFKGYQADKSLSEFKEIISDINCSIISQTNNLAYADKLLYALRDKTATVDSLPLIASSVMSKKLASGAKYLLLNVHYGSGAFMKTKKEAIMLAKIMVKIGNISGVKTRAVISYMGQPLSDGVGCTLEVESAINNLKQNDNHDLLVLTKVIAKVMLSDIKNISKKQSKKLVNEVLDNGKAVNRLEMLIKKHNGSAHIINDINAIEKSEKTLVVKSAKNGYVSLIDALSVAKVVNHLKELNGNDRSVLNVGVKLLVTQNQKVCVGDNLAKIHYNNDLAIDKIVSELESAITIKKFKSKKVKLIAKII